MVASSSSNQLFLSLKLLLISAGVVTVTVTAKLLFPFMFNFASNDLPAIWSVVTSWLKPPYVYVVINAIIITIVASTRFQPNHSHDNQPQHVADFPSDLPPLSVHSTFGVMEPSPVTSETNPVDPPVMYESKRANTDVETVPEFNFPVKVQPECNFPVKEKKLVTSRFGHNRKPAKSMPEGVRALRVLKPKKHETLDSTWKMITETRKFRKSDTFVNIPSDEMTATANTKVVRKSETFKDRTAYENQNHHPMPSSENLSPVTGGKLKKDLSPSHEELNRRVEAFIKKFNEDMRLQREESLNQYMEMVNRGAR